MRPAGKGTPKLVAQIGDLVGRHRIGMGLQKADIGQNDLT
jgi:hypothetical protein